MRAVGLITAVNTEVKEVAAEATSETPVEAAENTEQVEAAEATSETPVEAAPKSKKGGKKKVEE